MRGIFALTTLITLLAAAPAAAAEVTSVQWPKRVKAGAPVTVVAAVKDVKRCALQATTASTIGADQVTFTFTASRSAKPGRYTLTLRCAGTPERKLRLTVTARKGTRGSSRTLIKGRIRATTRRATTPLPQHLPPCCKTFNPAPVATPTPTPTPVVPGPQNSFRAVYAIPSDQAETPGHVDAIKATVEAVNGWFATQTIGGVQPRWMRDAAGALQVTVARLARPAATYEADDGFARLREDLEAVAPLAAPTQKSVVFMEVDHPGGDACGSNSAGISWITEDQCDIHPVAPATWPFEATYLTAHEMTHNFGAVLDCAPHSTKTGHVNDDPRDLLFSAGPLDWNNLTLDPGRDDYYATGNACGDIAKSEFWTVTADPRS